MCSYHGHCTYNDASCQAQHPDSTSPSNTTATGASHCYFCRTRAHPTDGWDRPCPHCQNIPVHRATACPNRTPTLPAAAVVLALTPLSAMLPPPPKYAMPVNVNPSTTPKMTGDISVIASYQLTQDSSSITDAMRAVWSTDLATKYLHLPWMLLNEPFKVEGLRAPDLVLLVPAVLRILGPNVAQRALEFIADGTIHATQ
uniref:Uncharacterized protein n=1 Tax=Romanomermis culicivorax TaxID=13658 RepID=A0A915JSV3_ROMCU